MEELIEVVFKNPFLLILILGGLFSLFKGRSSQNKKGHEAEQTEGPGAPTARKHSSSPLDRSTTQHHIEEIKKSSLNTLSIEEQREEQMKRLSNQLNRDEHSGLTDRPKIAAEKRKVEVQQTRSKYNKKFKKDFKKSLTRKGLANSVIMAEVLGVPRVRRPYQSVVDNRKNR